MYQQITIIGNLGRDPEMRYLSNGTPVTDFSVAVNRQWTNRDGSKGEETTWFKVTCWRKLAETTYQYLKKGRQVFVTGRVEAEAWTGRDGEPRSTMKITAQTVKFLQGGERGQMGEMEEPGGYDGSPDDNYQEEEDLPF